MYKHSKYFASAVALALLAFPGLAFALVSIGSTISLDLLIAWHRILLLVLVSVKHVCLELLLLCLVLDVGICGQGWSSRRKVADLDGVVHLYLIEGLVCILG